MNDRFIRYQRRYLIGVLLVCLIWMVACAIVFGATTNRIYVSWDNAPEYDTNVSFFIYSWTNLTELSWQPYTNITWVQWYTNQTVELPTPADSAIYFVVTASNLFGESDFSEPVGSRRLSRVNRVRIGAF